MTQDNWLQAQYSVLGSALIEPSVVPKVIQQTRMADFSGQCQTIYATMRKLFQDGHPVDVVSVAAALGDEYNKFLMDLMQIVPTAANLDYYITLSWCEWLVEGVRYQYQICYALDVYADVARGGLSVAQFHNTVAA